MKKVETAEKDKESASVSEISKDVEIEFDEKKGVAKFTLENGINVSLKEPKAEDFVYFSSYMKSLPAWKQTDIIGVYVLTWMMITEISGTAGRVLPETFEIFMGWLEDRDLERIGAAFSMFPNVTKRITKLFTNGAKQGTGD